MPFWEIPTLHSPDLPGSRGWLDPELEGPEKGEARYFPQHPKVLTKTAKPGVHARPRHTVIDTV